MPASSKAQQRLMGLVKAVQAGDIPKSKVTKKIKQLAKNMKQKDVKKYASTKHKNLPDKVRESKTSDMMRDIRKGGAAGPWNIIVSKNNKVVSQVSVKNLKEIPAYLAALRPRYPNHKIGIESKGGKIVYRESVNEDGRAIMKSISNAKKGAVAKGGGYAPFVKMGKNSWKQAKTNTKTHDDGLFDKIGGFKDFIVEACWDGYKQVGMKKGKKGKQVPNCVPEVVEHCGCEHKDTYDVFSEAAGLGYTLSFCTDKNLKEAEYQGRKVKLNKPMQGDVGKFKVYVKNDKGNVVKVNFGAKGSENRIKKSDPARRKSFRARHNCDSPGPKHKARYWSCRKW